MKRQTKGSFLHHIVCIIYFAAMARKGIIVAITTEMPEAMVTKYIKYSDVLFGMKIT